MGSAQRLVLRYRGSKRFWIAGRVREFDGLPARCSELPGRNEPDLKEKQDGMTSDGRSAPYGRAPVCILLSVYNGGTYLDALLRSLVAQTHANWRLIWRDDGSCDESRQILHRFASTLAPGQCREITHGAAHLGVAKSFGLLLEHVPPQWSAAFCDQDDVWFPDKLERGLKALATACAPERPALYCSAQVLTDARLQEIGRSPLLPAQPTFLMALTQNIATGCTIILSPAAVDLVRAAMPPPKCTLHDWWSYLLVSGAGGVVVADNTPSLYYRQHQSNTVGAPTHFMARALAAIRRGPSVFMQAFVANVDCLLLHRQVLREKNLVWLLELHHAMTLRGVAGGLERYRLLHRLGQMRRATVIEQQVFRLWFVLGARVHRP